MSGAFVLFVLLFSLLIPLVLWLAIADETSNPTVVDRTEAERLARERGGRPESRSNADGTTLGTEADDHESELGWETRTEDADRDDRCR
ncbi:hypothetical protein [Natronorubrum sp. DTA28]|uniref:hypothetical protein n=1 Tax=Natronorubrum sp. DTA28 TaxID=3447019 RepID=UPI003F83EB71